MRRLVIAAAILLTHVRPAEALLLWNWSYGGTGVSASGTFTTNDTPDEAGFYQTVGITGADNGVTITGLQPTGTAIPGNEPYAVDNLVSAGELHLTTHGFGFSLANGNYANPFYNGSSYYEYLSVPPYINGAGPERPVSFSAAIVPEPSAASLLLAALVAMIIIPKAAPNQVGFNVGPGIRGQESFRGRLAHVSRWNRHRVVQDLPCRPGYTVGCQAPSTKKASLSPGHGGIVAPMAVRGSGPSQRN
jgi:hypothetical protein